MNQINNKYSVILWFMISLIMLGACSTKTAIRGNQPTPSQIAMIKNGQTTRQEVIEILGNPSTKGTFDSQVWYYISRETSQWAFLPENIVDQQVIAIYFDSRGKVQHLEHYRTEDRRNVDLVERETRTTGQELGFWEQILGNLGLGIPMGN